MADEKLDDAQLEGKSLEELESLEDALVAEDGEDQGRDPNAEVKPPPAMQESKPEPKQDKDDPPADPPADPAKAGDDPPLPDVKADGEADGDEPPLPPVGDQPSGDPEPQKSADQIRKNISPPSKWAKYRHEQNELKSKLEVAETKAAQTDHLKENLDKLQKEMEWMKSALASKNVDLPTDPLEMFTDDRLKEVQDEFGSEVADLFRATKAALGGNLQPQAPKQDPQPGTQPPAQGATPPAQPPAGDQPEDPEVVAIREAMQNNDHLMYWAEEKTELFNRAIEVDAAWLKHPQYLNLPYDKRFEMVVKQVQDEEIAKGVTAANTQEGDAKPDVPASLSGSGGEAPTQGGMSPAERVLAAPTTEKQEEIYNSMTDTERDQVDLELGI